MSFTTQSILRAALRKEDEPLNIISVNPSERYQQYLAETGHNFYSIGKRWNHSGGELPTNVKELFFLENGIPYDLVLCFGRERGLKEAMSISYKYHIPLILLEKNYPNPNREIPKGTGDVNVFISDIQAKTWGYRTGYTQINNCVDIDLFALDGTDKKQQVLTAVEDWKERDWSHGFRLYHKNVSKELPIKLLGQNKYVNWQELIDVYNESKVYFHPSLLVPQAHQILEALACGCIVIAFDNEVNREIIRDGVNGFLVKPENATETIKKALAMKWQESVPIALAAADTITAKYSLKNFVKNWNETFKAAANKPFIGREQ